MGEIPDDVKEAATEAAADRSWNGVPNEAWVQVIARAILAERQRCADVAGDFLEYLVACRIHDRDVSDMRKAILNP